MAFCKNCGAQIDDQAIICPKCGVAQGNRTQSQNSDDKGGFLWSLLGFCIPLVGLILYLVWKESKPVTAKAAGKGALVSVIVIVVLYALIGVLFAAL